MQTYEKKGEFTIKALNFTRNTNAGSFHCYNSIRQPMRKKRLILGKTLCLILKNTTFARAIPKVSLVKAVSIKICGYVKKKP